MNPQSSCPAANKHERNHHPGTGPGPRPPRPRRARPAAVITVLAAGLLTAACGGSPSSTGSAASPNAGGPPNDPIPLAYSQCMRSHGVPGFPDPNGSGQIAKDQILRLRVSGPRLQAASQACAKLWPYRPSSQAEQRQQLTAYLKFAQCMRSHGVPGFPDPTNHDGHVEFVISISKDGFDPHSAQILAKAHQCKRVLPAGPGLPEVTVSP